MMSPTSIPVSLKFTGNDLPIAHFGVPNGTGVITRGIPISQFGLYIPGPALDPLLLVSMFLVSLPPLESNAEAGRLEVAALLLFVSPDTPNLFVPPRVLAPPPFTETPTELVAL
mmetsp:Transcript_98757/g.205852  ORF Transcript_98757/g.205852 Transcript_98757/m.205852 type:complete len:114 (+) Transcript_98757:1078-1419(+)